MATKKTFKHLLGATVAVKVSGEKGEIRSRLHSLDTNPQYLVLYKAADGRALKDWFYEDDLSDDGSSEPEAESGE